LAAPLTTQRLFGCDFVSDASIANVADALVDEAADPTVGWRCVITPNVDHVVRYARIPSEADVARRASLTLPDGMPIVWASRLLHRPLRSRLPGSDLFDVLWPELARRDLPSVVIASDQAVADGLTREHPGSKAVVAPYFTLEDHEVIEQLLDDALAACAEIDARMLFVGVSMEKHHRLAARLAARFDAGTCQPPTVLLVGASPNFYLGLSRRAPRWMQRAGLEWVHRLAQDPARMGRRYLVDDVQFVRLLWREWQRTRPRRRELRRASS
jgi:N-acetylglucosaminyldiphosphoundecaprenol N-acetyl-beta-D-mannosaminyltransferase